MEWPTIISMKLEILISWFMKRQKICKFCILERNFFLGGNYTGDILGHLTAVGQFQGNCITSQSGLGWLAALGEPPKHWRGESGCVMSHLSGRGEIFDADNEISFSVAVPQVKTGPANPFWHQIDLSIVSPVASQRIIDAFFFLFVPFFKTALPGVPHFSHFSPPLKERIECSLRTQNIFLWK